ncbi:MAG: hypothetical protein D3917_07325 [Candidatus Electrothrix sp. AX5]|nr:hypothetical protein [Candidatus Electrothrix sp. AX5]
MLLVQVNVELLPAVTEVGSAVIVTAGEGFVLTFGVMTKKFPDFQGNTTAETDVAEEMRKQPRIERINSSVIFFTRNLKTIFWTAKELMWEMHIRDARRKSQLEQLTIPYKKVNFFVRTNGQRLHDV